MFATTISWIDYHDIVDGLRCVMTDLDAEQITPEVFTRLRDVEVRSLNSQRMLMTEVRLMVEGLLELLPSA